MSKTVSMVARIGDQYIDVGRCNSAQARILTKKQHAAWQDGKLVLHIRPIHLQVAENHLRLEGEEHEVSNAELDRRLNWLKTIVQAVFNADTAGPPEEGYRKSMLAAEQRSILAESVMFRSAFDDVLSDEDVGDFYEDVEHLPLPDVPLEEIWESASDVSRIFGNHERTYCGGATSPSLFMLLDGSVNPMFDTDIGMHGVVVKECDFMVKARPAAERKFKERLHAAHSTEQEDG